MFERGAVGIDGPSQVRSPLSAWFPWILVLSVLSIWLGNWYLIAKFVDEERRGQFGDQFGAVNALFSGLAFAGLISAILLQKRELALQREQLELQRAEMRESRLQLAEQARVQEGSRKAAIAGLRIEALKAEISALEMESLTHHFSYRVEFVARIRNAAEKMTQIVEDLESGEIKTP